MHFLCARSFINLKYIILFTFKQYTHTQSLKNITKIHLYYKLLKVYFIHTLSTLMSFADGFRVYIANS